MDPTISPIEGTNSMLETFRRSMQVAVPGDRWSPPNRTEIFQFHPNDKTTYSKFHCNLNQFDHLIASYTPRGVFTPNLGCDFRNVQLQTETTNPRILQPRRYSSDSRFNTTYQDYGKFPVYQLAASDPRMAPGPKYISLPWSQLERQYNFNI